jgi:hypothetical protein
LLAAQALTAGAFEEIHEVSLERSLNARAFVHSVTRI